MLTPIEYRQERAIAPKGVKEALEKVSQRMNELNRVKDPSYLEFIFTTPEYSAETVSYVRSALKEKGWLCTTHNAQGATHFHIKEKRT